ncbi:hypothetical protein BT69DRAFT_1290366 [Atractiella rhizophila]|nr:hypothetical protein BT69DRAFT_1290366 [Atractiella rhizophila]
MDDGVVTGTMVLEWLSARVGGAGKTVCRRKECFDVWIRWVVSGCSGRCRNVSPTKNRVQGRGHDSALQLGSFVQVSI